MTTADSQVEKLVRKDYEAGFYTDIEQDTVPPGLDEDVIRFISAKKNEPEFLLEWRLEAFRAWQKMVEENGEPAWAHVDFVPVDYQAISYYAAPKKKEAPKSLDEVDPRAAGDLRKARHPARRAEDAYRCRG